MSRGSWCITTCFPSSASWLKLPNPIVLDAASLPEDVDVFRMADAWTVILVTERFVDAVKRLELDGVTFRELETR